MIEVEKLTHYFGNITAIEDVTFKVDKGEIPGFLGLDATGKTTTGRILTGFLPVSKEIASVANFVIFQSPLEVKKRIDYLPESSLLYTEMSVYFFLNVITELKSIDTWDRKQKISVAIEKGGIDDRD